MRLKWVPLVYFGGLGGGGRCTIVVERRSCKVDEVVMLDSRVRLPYRLYDQLDNDAACEEDEFEMLY